INQIFLGICLATLIWLGGLLIILKFPLTFSLFGGRVAFAGASLIPLFFLLFSFNFPRQKKINPFILYFICFVGMFFFFATLFTHLVVKSNVEKIAPLGISAKFGVLYTPFGIYFLIFLLWGVQNFIYQLRSTKVPLERNQVYLFLLGTALSLFFGSLPNLVIPLFFRIYGYSQLGPFATIFFIFFTALAITRYHLFGIEVILTELMVGVIGILLIVQIFMAPALWWKIVNGIIFALFCISGWLLIRYTFREIKRREELEKISRAKSEFISITSHQLRTPLTAIKGYISMILEGTYGEVSERIKKVLENVFKANERMIKLTNAFLDVSKIELGTLELKKEPSQIENLISEVISEIEIEAKSKNLYLEFEKPKVPLPKILIDREKIKEVLSNLIDNAVKYTPKGGVKIQCKMANSRAIIVEVRDTGAGMTKEEISKLFESFSRGSAGQRFWTEGAGLGLYVAKKIVELHKGKIWAESAGKGKGSTFFVELPIT
ncbi:hypothetical protein H5T58_01145, partial [Candidatus Parcubacteria bacterium]|nr:hypothetical protein [Candidatus Parcubacteria bacterium]